MTREALEALAWKFEPGEHLPDPVREEGAWSGWTASKFDGDRGAWVTSPLYPTLEDAVLEARRLEAEKATRL